ncbi:hypothetical protein Tco_1516713 [Tanacetum coccineum]
MLWLNRHSKLMLDHAELSNGKSILKDPDIFLTQSEATKAQSEEPKEESNSFPSSIWTIFQKDNLYLAVEVFGMAIPDPLITEVIQQSSYFPKYLEMVAENSKKTPQEGVSMQHVTKRATPKNPTTTTPVKQSKPAPPPTKKPSKHLERAKKMSLEALQEQREGEGDDADLERAIKLSLDPAFLPQGRAPVGGVTIRDPVSETTSKLHEVVGKGKAVVTEEQVAHSLIDLSKKKRTTDQFILVKLVLHKL